jgi:hypothetical protein
MNPNTTWSSSLESYHPYQPPKKVSKNIRKYIVFTTPCPKMQKAILAAFIF